MVGEVLNCKHEAKRSSKRTVDEKESEEKKNG